MTDKHEKNGDYKNLDEHFTNMLCSTSMRIPSSGTVAGIDQDGISSCVSTADDAEEPGVLAPKIKTRSMFLVIVGSSLPSRFSLRSDDSILFHQQLTYLTSMLFVLYAPFRSFTPFYFVSSKSSHMLYLQYGKSKSSTRNLGRNSSFRSYKAAPFC